MILKKKFFLNGQQYWVYENLTIQAILNYFNYPSNFFIIEYNNVICNQNEWENLQIYNDDKIELITIVGGG